MEEVSFPLHHRVQTGSGVHLASYHLGTWVKPAGAWS